MQRLQFKAFHIDFDQVDTLSFAWCGQDPIGVEGRNQRLAQNCPATCIFQSGTGVVDGGENVVSAVFSDNAMLSGTTLVSSRILLSG